MNQRDWIRAVLKAVGYAVTTALIILAMAVLLAGPSQRERRETNENVRLLVEEARKNRIVLCIAVVRNPANAASADPELRQLCAEVGVEP